MSSSDNVELDLDLKLTKLISEHTHFRALLWRNIKRALTLCNWYYEQEVPSFLRRFENVDKFLGLMAYLKDHTLQSFQIVDRAGNALLAQVDLLLARPVMPAAVSPVSETHSSPGRTGSGPGSGLGVNGSVNGSAHDMALHLHDPSSHTHPAMPMNNLGPLSNNRLLYLAGEVKEAIRFWREQCLFVHPLDQKVAELDRIVELRNLAVTDERSTVEEKARAVRISSEQSKLVTDHLEVLLIQWSSKVAEAERPRDDHNASFTGRVPHPGHDGSAGPPHLSLEHRSLSSHSIGSPAAGYSSQPWGHGS